MQGACMKIILLGPPGAGKGTIAEKLKQEYNIPQISTGDLFRAAIANQTELGKKVKSILDAGELVPDELTIALVQERLSAPDTSNGYILDGFPRTIPQAEALERFDTLDMVIDFRVRDGIIIERLAGRRVCSSCGKVYHIKNMPPQKDGVCDTCGGALYTRTDDNPDSIQQRLKTYREKTEPLIAFYSERKLLKALDGEGSVEVVWERFKKLLGN